MPVKRGIAIWISGFFTFLAILCSFGAVLYWIREGPDFIITPYLLSYIMGSLSVMNSFYLSITASFIFIGLTCIIAYRKVPLEPEITKIREDIIDLRKTQQTTAMEMAASSSRYWKNTRDFNDKVNINLENTRTETLATLEKQRKAMQHIHRDIGSTVENNVGETRKRLLGVLKKQDAQIQQVGRLSREGVSALKEQGKEIEGLIFRLDKIEERLLPLQPSSRLNSRDTLEEIKGIGPRLGDELRAIGITNVGELITAESTLIDEKTRLSLEMTERLQSTAQLLTIPGLDENDVELLIDAGVTSRKELADQDLIQLSRKIGEITKIYIEEGKMSEDEKPTIEEISSWIKITK